MAARKHHIAVILAAGALIAAGCSGSGRHQDAADQRTATPAPSSSRPAPGSSRPAPGSSRPASTPTHRPTQRPAPPKVSFPASLPRSIPISVSIPAIGVEARTMRLGLTADGSVQTPPSSPDQITGWFERSPTPGELGAPAVILGHIDSHRYGPEVFWRLHELKAGDVIAVGRQDGTTAKFAVEKIEQYAKAQFPKVKVYGGGSALDRPGIRLITCGGAFDAAKRSYKDNVVAYATLVS